MHKIQIITSSSGDEMVVIPKADYDALVAAAVSDEDDEDVAIYDARKTQLAAEGVMPLEVSQALLAGDSLLKAIRKYRRMTQEQLADAAGLAQGFLSDLENRRRGLTDASAAALATALDVPLDWLKR